MAGVIMGSAIWLVGYYIHMDINLSAIKKG